MTRALVIALLVAGAPRLALAQTAEERFRNLPPPQQEELRQKFRQLQQLPPVVLVQPPLVP